MRRLIVTVSIALVGVMAFAGPSANAAGQSDDARREHQRIVDYWTAERRDSAIPRDMTIPSRPNAKPTEPGNGNGKGGGKGGGGDDGDGTASTTVTGATWTGGGDIVHTTGKVFFTLAGARYQCSASAADSEKGNLVVTAGHCVHEGDGGEFASNWAFYPAYDGTAHETLGVWTATHLFTTSTWADAWAGSSDGFDDDAGFALVTGTPETDLETAISGVGATVPTVDFDLDPEGVDYFSFGYPAEKKYKGTTLTYCAGPVTGTMDSNATLAIACDMNGGSSGGPWIRENSDGGRVLNSVNSYGYLTLKGYMFGPIFDEAERAAYEAADSSSCSAASIPCATMT